MRPSVESVRPETADAGLVAGLGEVLGPLHESWVEETRCYLDPASCSSAPFWDRWSVVRYLNDQFPARFALEYELIRELRPFMERHHAETLEAGAERLVRLRLGLDRLGRRRGTSAEFAPMVEEFLLALELWCAEIELAVRTVQRRDLPAEGSRLLARLEAGLPAVE
jgi:hypothetical protein